MKRILIALTAPLLLAACTQEQPTEYQNEPGIYFFRSPYVGPVEQRDSLEFAFYVKQVVEGGIFEQMLDVRTIGGTEQRVRPFRIRQTNAGQPGAAVAGKHYVAFDDARMLDVLKIPAGATQFMLPIMCINDSELADKKVRLEIEIDTNAEFGPVVKEWSKFVITFGDIAVRPQTWIDNDDTQSWFLYFGMWSAEKMRFISNTIGLSDFDLAMNGNVAEKIEGLSTGRMKYFNRVMWLALQEYNAAHPETPLRDENDNLITFPGPDTITNS